MGNSSSSHNISKASRSVSFSDLPYKLDKSYTSKGGGRASTIGSASPRQSQAPILRDPKLSAKRSTSLGSHSDSSTLPSSKSQRVDSSKIVASQQQQRHSLSANPQQSGPRQYNDDRIQKDIKKLFKAHDRSNTKALVDDTASIDKKLATLKQQRSKQDQTNGTENETLLRKSRKAKKAPTLPSPSPVTPAVTIETKQALRVANGDYKNKHAVVTKKRSAPAPPSAKPSSSPDVTIPVVSSSVNNNNNTEMKDESQEMTIPDTSNNIMDTETAEVKLEHPLADNVAYNNSNRKSTTIIERELRGTSKTKKQKKAPQAPPSATTSPDIPVDISQISIDVSPEIQAEIAANDEESFIEAITKKAVEEDKRLSQREVVIQDDAPVDLAAQCDSSGGMPESNETDERLGNILKLFIDKNAEKDASRNADESSLDSETILADLEESEAADTSEMANHDKASNDAVTEEQDRSIRANEGNATKPAGQSHITSLDAEIVSEPIETEENDRVELTPANLVLDLENSETSLALQTSQDEKGSAESETYHSNCKPVQDTPNIELAESKSKEHEVAKKTQQPPQHLLHEKTGDHEELPVTVNGEEVTNGLEQVDTAQSSKSPTNSNDSGHDEPSDYSGSTAGESHLNLNLSPSLSAAPDLSTAMQLDNFDGANTSESQGNVKSSPRKHKSMFSGIFRVTKTMRSFMTSKIGKLSHKPTHQEAAASVEAVDEPVTLSADNWTLADKGKKPVPRKMYITWDESTFLSPDRESTTTVTSESKGTNDHAVNSTTKDAIAQAAANAAADAIADAETETAADAIADAEAEAVADAIADAEAEAAADAIADAEAEAATDAIADAEAEAAADAIADAADTTTTGSPAQCQDAGKDIKLEVSVVVDKKGELPDTDSPSTTTNTQVTSEVQTVSNTAHGSSQSSDNKDSERGEALRLGAPSKDKEEVQLRKESPAINEHVVNTKISGPSIEKRNSALALMSPKGYGSASSVYRPVSKPVAAASPN